MNDGTTIKANIIEIRDGVVIYRVAADVSGQTFYLSSSRLDSLRYSDGRSMVFLRDERSPQLIKRNYIGIDLYETILGYINEKDPGYKGSLNRLYLY
ncbi:MAG: hypothetical protein IH594_10330, partial [Bacteroidales bacterium]|nr:hypothetical protein [Bacteroidales bacterium]